MSFFTEIQIVDPTTGTPVNVNSDGQMHVVAEGHLCTSNSTETPLSGGASWTGDSENILAYNGICVFVTADVASAVGGLEIQYSSDDSTWYTAESYTVLAGAEKWFTPPAFGKFFRVKYTNGAGAQSTFVLTTVLRKMPFKWSSHNIDDPITDQDDAELVKAVNTGKDPNGTYRNVNVTQDGYMAISDNSSGLAIAEGNVTGRSSVSKFGQAKDFDTGDGFVTVWDGAEDGAAWEQMLYQYSTTADIDSISSSDAGDNHDITIIGLDSNWDEVTQTVTLNGQTRVALTTSLIRVYRAYNGNSTEFSGNVIIYVNTALTAGVPTDTTKIRAVIDPIAQQTLMCVYSVPAGKTAYLTRGYASTAGGSKTSNYVIQFFVRNFGKVFRLQNVNSIGDTASSNIVLDYFVPLAIPEKSDLEVRVNATAVGVFGASVAAGFDLILVDD